MSDRPGAPAPRSREGAGWLPPPPGALTSLVLTIPVFLTYHLGILLIDLRNGADLVSHLTFELLDRSLGAYVGVTLGFAAGLVLALVVLRRRRGQTGKLEPLALGPVLVESGLLAIGMLVTVGWATDRLFRMQAFALPAAPLQAGPPAMGPLDKLVMAAGAGFHEELVFRVLLFGGGAWALERSGLSKLRAGLAAALVSAVLFSAIHYVGAFGDPFSLVSFTFRALAGLYLTAVYRFRGFAAAVYTHAFYDLLVFFVL